VIDTPEGIRHLLIDGFVATSDAGSASSYMYWMGSLPALLHPNPEQGLVICFGTGQTVNGMRREGVPQIDVVELSPQIYELAPLFAANGGVLEDSRVHPIVMDGRAWLRRSDTRYDLITLEPMPPNFSGVNALYSKQFYELAASRMSPRGVIAQWLPIHMLTRQHAAAITATFLEVFGDAILWFDPLGGTGVLLGRRAGALQPLGKIWPGLGREPVARPLSATQIQRSVWLRQNALERYAQSGAIISDDNQLLQYGQLRPASSSARAFALNQENMMILENFAGRAAFSLRGAGARAQAR
jgi:spermidine synthase